MHPWDTGDAEANWLGYFLPGTTVLRNRIGATTARALENAENDLVEARIIELRDDPSVLGDRSYDLIFLLAIHRHLFRDVYDWAGQIRTVGISKGDESFCPPGSIAQPMHHVAAEVHRLGRLRSVASADLPKTVAYLYDYVNFAHPFREGNGRSTREFFDLLLAERGSGLDWERTDRDELYRACHAARADSDISGLTAMFSTILDDDAAYDF
ncbi:Fic/DOC family protein [Millisia brevis]|uniref:Fic/DOC family protein n=1 Tax=Millisia brevis TaxID=264148 RepID=UPI000837787E|nr:Fic/DOC family protein [Millisia brevis]